MVVFEIAVVNQCSQLKIDSREYSICCVKAVKSVASDPSFDNVENWDGCSNNRWWFQNHVRRGLYSQQLEHWYKHFHRDNVFIFISEGIPFNKQN